MPTNRQDRFSEQSAPPTAPTRRFDSANDSWLTEMPRVQPPPLPVKASTTWFVRILGLIPRIGFASSHFAALLLFCLPWVDITCAKNRTGTVFQGASRVEQSGLQMTYGGVTRYAGTTKTMAKDPKLAAPILYVYAGCLLLGVLVAVVPWHRWRAGLALFFSLGAILALTIQLIIGFPIIEASGNQGLWSLNAGITWVFIVACLSNAGAFVMSGTDLLIALFVFRKPHAISTHPPQTQPNRNASE